MKRLRTAACIAVIALCLPGILRSARELPQDNQALVAKKYAGWSGVLRIWAFEGWTDGDLAARWINSCAATFEKNHPGVYIEVIYPGAEAVKLRERAGVRTPDLILFPPGLLDSSDGLCMPPRAVALGGYAWAINDGAEGIAIPADEEWRCWTEAARQLGDPNIIIEETENVPPGIDLGLPVSASAGDALTRFINGELFAVPVTQREIARLERLREQGRGPDWRIQTGGSRTDQVFYLSAVQGGQEALAMELIDHLLSEPCQQNLRKVNLFSPVGVAAGYPPGSAMAAMEGNMLTDGFTPSGAFNMIREP